MSGLQECDLSTATGPPPHWAYTGVVPNICCRLRAHSAWGYEVGTQPAMGHTPHGSRTLQQARKSKLTACNCQCVITLSLDLEASR